MTGSDTGSDSSHSSPSRRKRSQGLPLWMPLLGLLAAFIVAVVVGAQICPTLTALVMPPEPPLPDGKVTRLQHEAKGAGLDEYVYGTELTGCRVAQFYKDRFGTCVFDPSVTCSSDTGSIPNMPDYHVAQCTGRQSIGAYSVLWTVYISTNYEGENVTRFRVVREVGN